MSSIAKARPLYMRKTWDLLLAAFSFVSIFIALGGMAWILLTVFSHGWDMINTTFLTSVSRPVDDDAAMLEAMQMFDPNYQLDPVGIGNALLGTISITFFATLMTVPVAMCAGIYLSEFGKASKFADFLRFCANVLMGVPSIIIGVFVYAMVVIPTSHFSGFAGSIALSIIMFPVIMRTTEDMMAMVPNTLRESALALGMTRMRTTLCIIARSAKNGLATGVLLSLARVSGETAPLLFTAMCSDQWPALKNFFSEPTANLPVLINNYTMSYVTVDSHNVGWGAALVVCAFILLINIVTRYFFRDTHKH